MIVVGAIFTNTMRTHKRKMIDLKSQEASDKNNLPSKDRMKELIEHAVGRHQVTSDCQHCEKNWSMENEETT